MIKTVAPNELEKKLRDNSGPSFRPFACLCVTDTNAILAFLWIFIARAVTVISNIYLSNALLVVMARAAGCPEKIEVDADGKWIKNAEATNSTFTLVRPQHLDDDEYQCEETLYGENVGTLLLSIITVSGFIVALVLPLFGAICDHTDHRRKFGLGAAVTLTVIQALQIFISEKTWLWVAFGQLLAAAAYQAMVTVTLAFLPLFGISSGVMDQKKVAVMGVRAQMWSSSGMVGYILFIVIVNRILDLNTVPTAMVSQAIAALLMLPLAIRGFMKGLPDVKGKPLPKGRSLFFAGIVEIGTTFCELRAKYSEAGKWLLGYICAESTSQFFIQSASVYTIVQLGADATYVSYVMLILLTFHVVGAAIASWLIQGALPFDCLRWKAWTPNNTLKFFIKMHVVYFIAFPTTLYKPAHQGLAFAMAPIWGIAGGGWYATSRGVFFGMVPGGKETEYSGLLGFCATVLVWVPLAISTALYRQFGTMRYFGAVGWVGWVLGWFLFSRVDMDKAHRQAHANNNTTETHKARKQSFLMSNEGALAFQEECETAADESEICVFYIGDIRYEVPFIGASVNDVEKLR